MTLVWVLVGAVGAWAVMWFRQTKAKLVQQARDEFAAFAHALDAWIDSPDDENARGSALHHFAIYDARRLDAMSHQSVPADRAAIATYWVKVLQDAQLLDSKGNPATWSEASAVFWQSIARLRDERDIALARAHFGSEQGVSDVR